MPHLDRETTLQRLTEAEQQGQQIEEANDYEDLLTLQRQVLTLWRAHVQDDAVHTRSLEVMTALLAIGARMRQKAGA